MLKIHGQKIRDVFSKRALKNYGQNEPNREQEKGQQYLRQSYFEKGINLYNCFKHEK